MLFQCSRINLTIGFYVAVHPWLKAAGFVKVGHSKHVETRLEMASFKTCFTPEWRYHCVMECESTADAHLLEQSVLYCLRQHRVAHRELLRLDEAEVVRAAVLVAKELQITHKCVENPDYSTDGESTNTSGKSKNEAEEEEEEEAEADLGTDDEKSSRSSHNSAHGQQTSSIAHVEILGQESAANVREGRGDMIVFSVDDAIDEAVPFEDPKQEKAIERVLPQLEKVGRLLNRNPNSMGGEFITDTTSKFNAPNTGSGADEDEEFDHETYMALCEAEEDENYELSKLRPYQEDAYLRVWRELRQNGKAICQMACRCGKTPVAFAIIWDIFNSNEAKNVDARVLYLVPGLALLRQTIRKLVGYGLSDVPILLVGSDPTPVYLNDEFSAVMTTDPSVVKESILGNRRIIVVSTYHSSSLLKAFNFFTLTVFDECHRVCGSVSESSFNCLLLQPQAQNSMRLFLTATPTYDTPIKMNNTDVFGGVAFRYYLREGINAGFVNPFSLRVVLGRDLNEMNPYLYEAMRLVDKMLVFCRNIRHAEELYEKLVSCPVPPDVAPFTVLIAHSRMGVAGVSDALARFMAEKRCLLFNVRLFQEGVEVPDLNAVFFAAPRFSSRDIIQSICRPLNRMEGKPSSFVFLPAVYHTRYAEDHPINLSSFSTLVPFTDALMNEDPRLFEYMIDPSKSSYDMGVIGVRSLKLTSEKLQNFVLPAIRRGVRFSRNDTDRLHRASRMPWKLAFAELRRVVLECNRYPKTNDAWVVGGTSISLYRFYAYARKGYELHLKGEQSYLQLHQIRDLESLPRWLQYGLKGPYPWDECFATLARLLRESNGKVPPLDIHKGGYIGLDATPLERLCGCLMHINQCDGKHELCLPQYKQDALDKLCRTYGLRWRKERTPQGKLKTQRGSSSATFLTESYTRFKHLFDHIESHPDFRAFLDKHFPGYPDKHFRMETAENLVAGIVPPRHNSARLSRNYRTEEKRSEDAGAVGKDGVRRSSAVNGVVRTVMCRICRQYVKDSEWEAHLLTSTHKKGLRALTSKPNI